MTETTPETRQSLRSLRPEIPTIDAELTALPAGKFQNKTLRPILKYQNDLLVQIFLTYIDSRKGVFHKKSVSEKHSYIADALQKDQNLRNFMLGTLVGHFTGEEYQQYLSLEKEVRKRAIEMLIQRLQDQLIGKK